MAERGSINGEEIIEESARDLANGGDNLNGAEASVSEARAPSQSNRSARSLWGKVRKKFKLRANSRRNSSASEQETLADDAFERIRYVFEDEEDFECYETDSDECSEQVFAVPALLLDPTSDAYRRCHMRRLDRSRLYMKPDSINQSKNQRANSFTFASKKGWFQKLSLRGPNLSRTDYDVRGPCPCAKCQEIWQHRNSKLNVFRRLGARPKERKISDSYVFHCTDNNSGCYDRIIESNLLPGMREPPPLPLRPIVQRREMRMRAQSVPSSFHSDILSYSQDYVKGAVAPGETEKREMSKLSDDENRSIRTHDSLDQQRNGGDSSERIDGLDTGANQHLAGAADATSGEKRSGALPSNAENIPTVESSDAASAMPVNIECKNAQGENKTQQKENTPAAKQVASGLRSLAMCGWYWGPMSCKEAEQELAGLPDGSFLVRDSANNCHLLSVSFRSRGTTCHTRISYSSGKFSFFSDEKGKDSAMELIEHAMKVSKEGMLCNSRGHILSDMSYPVRLLTPISRFSTTPRLQHLCRFVIRENIRCDQLDELPLPKSLIRFLKGNHFRVEN